MRLVVWNCNMALDRKFAALQSLKPDIAIVPECANLEILRAKAPLFVPNEAVWTGDKPNKGLGVYAYNGYRLKRHPLHDPAHRIMTPIEVSGPLSFHLLAIWSFNDRGAGGSGKRVLAPVRALAAYDAFCRAAPLVVAGDFNHNVAWYKPTSTRSHARTIEALAALNLVSAYHDYRDIPQGEEPEPTHYWRDRKKDRGRYHIDYIFLPRPWAGHLREVTVGKFEEWCGNKLSDHVPLVADIDLDAAAREVAE